MTTASAPGKVILFGEHAVVYGRHALAVPVTQVQATVSVEAAPGPLTWIEAAQIGLKAPLETLPATHPLAFAVRAVYTALGIEVPPPLHIQISSSIPIASGLGSGTAVSVALIRALAAHLGQPLSPEGVSAIAFKVERLHHGTPSGIDNTVIAHGVPVCFKREQPGELLRVACPFSLLIGDTGVRAPTRDSVAAVRALWESDPPGCEAVFDRIGEISLSARRAIEQGKLDALGPLMDENHSLLQQLTVSSPELDRLVAAARQAGARGAKLSGGGRGGNMIALAGEAGGQEIRARLLAAGAAGCLETRIAGPG